ncbi:competence/damage-inducible protein A [soil metagenome]
MPLPDGGVGAADGARVDDRVGVRAHIVAIGAELVAGDIVDTNSAWLAARLVEAGIEVRGHTCVGDDVTEIVAVLRAAAIGCDVVVVTGGIGPTPDDLTRFAVADLAGVALERRDELAEVIRTFFADLGRPLPPSNLVQADLPVGADAIPAAGTAPGFALSVAGVLIVCLPGVPSEMRQMTEDSVLPLLRRRGGLTATVRRTVHTAGIAESVVAERCADLVDQLASVAAVQLAFLASRAQTRVQITARARDTSAAHALADPIVAQVVDRLGTAVVGLDDEGVAFAVARELRRRDWTLAVAESITGGGVGARLVEVPGASTWFAGGVIAYATAAKPLLADVPDRVLAEHGPVSEQTAAALATGVRGRLQVDVALAVVGEAGPKAQGHHDIGTVCLAVALPGDVLHARTVRLPPRSRVDLQQFSASTALDYLRRRLASAAEPVD